ncbi:MAG: hypothetical protein OHK0038_13760 [Flammeovirgaceae bacterium]
MEKNFLKNLASDLLKIEVNTIITDNTAATKMPSNRRMALLDIARAYREVLINYGICQRADGNPPVPLNDGRVPELLRWDFAGEFSFIEIRDRAKKGIAFFRNQLELTKNEEKIADIKRKLKLLERIELQSYNLVGMFKLRRKEFEAGESNAEGTLDKPIIDGVGEYDLFPSQPQSRIWNNDLSVKDINEYGDFELAPDQITMIRKIWEIGTQQVLMQTVIQIDGDVTSYITPQFIELPHELRRMVLNMHNESITTATNFWSALFKTIANLAGKAIDKLFAK